MKIHLMQQLLELNQAFENVILGLERMEEARLFDKQQVRYTRAEVESARVDANREFFDNFEEIVEKDAEWAYEFVREYDRKTKDSFDLYLESKEREEVRRNKGLPPRAVLFPDWDKDDEHRHDEEQAKKRSEKKRRMATRKPKPRSAKTTSHAKGGVAPAPERKK